MDNYLNVRSQYESVSTSPNSNDYELYNTEYHSPEPVYSTPETYFGGFHDRDQKKPIRGWSDSSKDSGTQSIVHRLKSRLSSLSVGKIGKAKGQPHTFKQRFFFWSSIFLSLLWCAPAVALLVLNGTGTIVGASAWCPTGNCQGIPVGTDKSLQELVTKADHDTHDFIGGLQFVAKAMEVWFTYIVVTLVYILTSMLARSEHGLPIGYLLTYMEFTDVLSLFKPSHWTSANHLDNHDPYKEAHRVRKFYFFAFGVAFLCVIANLIGPSVAVLMIPTVQSVPTSSTFPERFAAMLSAAAPQGSSAIPYCSAEDLAKEDWNCTSGTYDYSLDSLIDYAYSQLQQDFLTQGNLTNGVAPPTQERALSFEFNVSAINPKDHTQYAVWAPNRQTIRLLSQDQEDYYDNVTNPNSPYAGFANSITLALQRQGPITGVTQSLWWGNQTITKVDQDREIHCYQDWWVSDGGQDYAKCFRAGTGWNSSSVISQFTTGTTDSGWIAPPAPEPIISTSFFSDNATFVLSDWSTGNLKMPPCFPNGTLPANSNCDWDTLFSAAPPAGMPANTTQRSNAFIVENANMNDTSIGFVFESYIEVGFTTYAVDVTNSSFSSSFGVVQINDLPDLSQTVPVAMNSSWYLATWSVKDGYDVSYFRWPARALQQTIMDLYDQVVQDGTVDYDGIDYLNWWQLGSYSVLQAASLLPYNTTNPNTDGVSDSDSFHPQFAKNAVRQVYTFGLNSRTSILGVTVLGFGIIIAMIRAIIGVWARVRHREPIELLVAAMKHEHKSEFDGCGTSEQRMAKIRFGIHDDMEEKIKFTKL